MIPLVFPHTYLSNRMMQILSIVFDRIGVYLPSDLNVPEQMQRWADSQTLQLRIPAAEDKDRLAAVMKEFRSWASLQSGGPGFDVNLLKAYHSTPPFFDVPFASQIRTDIQQRATSPNADAAAQTAASDPLLAARIFLSIAQQLDEQADALDRDLAVVDARQQEMLAELQDDRPSAPTAGYRAEVHEHYMLTERLQAWAQLAAADAAQSGPDAPALFVTAIGEVLERIVDRLPEGVAIERPGTVWVPAQMSEAMADWRQVFLHMLTSLATDRPAPNEPPDRLPAPPPVAAGHAGLRIEVIRIANRSVAEVLGVAPASQTAADPRVDSAGNTVVVSVESAMEAGL